MGMGNDSTKDNKPYYGADEKTESRRKMVKAVRHQGTDQQSIEYQFNQDELGVALRAVQALKEECESIGQTLLNAPFDVWSKLEEKFFAAANQESASVILSEEEHNSFVRGCSAVTLYLQNEAGDHADYPEDGKVNELYDYLVNDFT